MFSALNQNSHIYILDKTDGVKFKIGEIVGTSIPIYATDGSNQMIMNIKVRVDGNVIDYNNVPSNNSIVTYNNGKIIICETKQGLQSEVESTLQHANYIIEHVEDYKTQVTDCETVLKELNPQYAKDKARDEEIADIKSEVAGIKDDISKILAAVTKT